MNDRGERTDSLHLNRIRSLAVAIRHFYESLMLQEVHPNCTNKSPIGSFFSASLSFRASVSVTRIAIS